MQVKIKKLHEDAIVPEYKTKQAAGFDFHVLSDMVIPSGRSVAIPIGLAMEIPKGYELQIRPRSGLSLKTGLRISNAPGTIDSDYRGEIAILVDNLAGDIELKKGDRIAQGVLSKVNRASFKVVVELSETERGEGGFGSTDEENKNA